MSGNCISISGSLAGRTDLPKGVQEIIMARYRGNASITLAACVIVIAGMKSASTLIVPILLAAFLAIICLPLLHFLVKKGVPEYVGLLLILSLVVALWFVLVLLVGSALSGFTTNVPFYQERLRVIVGEGWEWLAAHGINVDRSMLEQIFDPAKIMVFVTGLLNGLAGILKNAFLILLMFIFMILEATGIPLKIIAISNRDKDALTTYSAITTGVNRYLAIKSMTSCVTGVVIYTFLTIQGVDFPILWGMFAFILNFVPNVGSLIASIPPIILALIQLGPSQALVTAMGYLTVNTVIGSIIEPKVMGQGVGLSALVVFLSLIFWGWVLGPVGMLLSVPLTMAAKIALAERESTRWISLLLSSNKAISDYLGASGKEMCPERE